MENTYSATGGIKVGFMSIQTSRTIKMHADFIWGLEAEMSLQNIRLPKQWLHWMKKAKLRKYSNARIRRPYVIDVAHHRWCVKNEAFFSCSTILNGKLVEFLAELPQTEKQFIETVTSIRQKILAAAYSIVYNTWATRQNELGEEFFPEIT